MPNTKIAKKVTHNNPFNELADLPPLDFIESPEILRQKMKVVLGASFSYELLQLMFALPYLKIELLEKNEIAHRQTASTWLKKLADSDIVRPQKMGRTTYYVNWRLMQLLGED